jgi:hypothetical protein
MVPTNLVMLIGDTILSEVPFCYRLQSCARCNAKRLPADEVQAGGIDNVAEMKIDEWWNARDRLRRTSSSTVVDFLGATP